MLQCGRHGDRKQQEQGVPEPRQVGPARAPVQRVCGFDTIMPYYKLELDYLPDAERIGKAIVETLAY